nr:hypothetical protein [Tanacetum cinerariifolium]
PRRKQRKEAEVSHDESEDEDHVPTPSSDLLPSGEGRKNNDEMFGVDDLSGEEVVMDTTTDVSTTIPVAAIIVTTAVLTQRAKEPEIPIKKKDQMMMDVEYVRQLEAKEQEVDENVINDNEELKKCMEIVPDDGDEKQKVDENVEPIIDDTEELKKCMEIVPDDGDEVLIEATPISSRSLTITDYIIHKEGKRTYFKIIRADGNSQVYQTFEKMFKKFNREDLEVLWGIVKDRFKKEKLVDDMDNLLFKTLKTMFEHHVEDIIWTYQQGLAKVKN